MDTARSLLSSAGRRPTTASTRLRGKSSDDISFMVKRFNEVLGMNLTLVSFDEISHETNNQLLQLLQQLLYHISNNSPEMKVDLSKESPENTAARITNFLVNILGVRIVKQFPAQEFSNGLLQGDKNMLYPIMFVLLERTEEYRTRVYLYKYLAEVKVPSEFFQYEDVNEIQAHYKQLLSDFKAAHQTTSDLRSKISSPEQLKNDIVAQEKEREQLLIKIDDLKKKITDMTNDPQKIIEVTRQLRKEMDQEEKLEQSSRDQKEKLKLAEELLVEAHTKLGEAEKDLGEGDIQTQIVKLESQVKHYENVCQNQLPTSIDQISAQIDALKRVKSMIAVSEATSAVESDIRALKEEISITQDKLNEQSQPVEPTQEDSRMASFSKMMASKKKDLSKKLDQYIKEIKKLDDKKKELEDELKEFEGKKIPTKEEFEKYKVDIMNTANRCREMKQEMALIKDETAILKRTEDILKSRDQKIEEFMQELEKKHGVQGFRDIQKNLENVSMAKGNVDEIKGATLEQISKVVQQINDEINAKKNLYKPKVAKLREARQDIQNLEHEYSEKKAAYENAKLGFESERSKLTEEMAEYQMELESSESVYHLINAQVLVNRMTKERVDNEREFRAGSKQLNVRFKTHQAMLTAEIQTLEEESKNLRERQRDIKENYEPAQKQITWFTNLKKMLECKSQIRDQYNHGTDINVADRSFAAPPLSRGPAIQPSNTGVDRLIIN